MKKIHVFVVAGLSLLFLSCVSTKTPGYSMVREEENFDYLTSKIEYPKFADEKFAPLNQKIQKIAVDEYQSFKAESKQLWDEPNYPGMGFSYSVQTDAILVQDNLVSVLLNNCVFDGGAHPNYTLTSFNFDAGALRFVGVTELTGRTLAELSELARAQLTAALVTGKGLTGEEKEWALQMIRDGTLPEEKHFSTFTCDGKTVTIYFEPYAVAPYAAGIQKVTIPCKQN